MDQKELVELVKSKFPFDRFPKPNPGQLEAILFACREFLINKKKHVILQAPTGIGKSLIATVVHDVLRAAESGWRTTISTATIGLQQQYIEDDKRIVDLRGRTNYSCPHDKMYYNSGSCRSHKAKGKCQPALECPYLRKRIYWCNKAELRSTNNSFQIEACASLVMKEENRANLIIADECHELESHLVDHCTINLDVKDQEPCQLYGFTQITKRIQKIVALCSTMTIGLPFQANDNLIDELSALHKDAEDIIESIEPLFEDQSRDDHEQLGDVMECLQSISDKAELMVEGGDKARWVIQERELGMKIVLKPVYSWQVAHYGMFRKADHFLHMSATICGFDEYAASMGMEPGSWASLDLPNPIPLKQRPIYILPRFKVSGGFKDYEGLGWLIDEIIGHHLGDNGIIHTVSFDLARKIMEKSNYHNKMLISRDRNEITSELKRPQKGRVILSPSIEKGYDFKGDMSRYQILPKVPFLYLGDPLIALNAEQRPKWYARQAILRIVQACGRSVRGVNDYADTYILDSNILRLLSQNKDLFPQWFLDSLIFDES